MYPHNLEPYSLRRLRPASAGKGTAGALRRDFRRPAVDIREAADEFILEVDLPGVDAADIRITMQDDELILEGDRRLPPGDSGHLRTERGHGSFARRFHLPDTVDGANISARSRNGVLEIRIPKQARVRPRKIQVESN